MRESSGGLSFSPRSNTPSSTTRAAPTEDADFLSRLPEPATEHDRSGSSSLTPVEDGGIFLVRADFSCSHRFSSHRFPTRSEPGAMRVFGYSDYGTGLYDSLFSLFRWFASPSLAEVVALLLFFAFPSTHSRPAPPLSGDMAAVFLDAFPVPDG